jgi:peptidoglycan/LPS O-acetylase OafA/YrhL
VPNTQQVENLKALTSLRFVAAFMIIIHHAPGLLHWSWGQPTQFPYVHGVSFFFVLSGFILTHVYSSKPMPAYGAFLRARFARLWPVHVFALCLLVLLVTPDSITFDGPGMFNRWVVLGVNLSMLHSVVPIISYTFSWNSVSWSISTEFFFYMAFPLLVVNIRRTWGRKLVAAAALAAAYIAVLYLLGLPVTSTNINEPTATFGTYPNPLMRCVEFCAGMATWVLWSNHIRGARLSVAAWTALEAAALALCAFWMAYAYWPPIRHMGEWPLLWYGAAGSFWVFAVLIAVFAAGRGWLARALSVRPLVFLGEISFSVYMLHQLLMKAFVTTFKWPDVPEIVYFPALFALATASYLLIEKPGQRLLLGRREPKGAPVIA